MSLRALERCLMADLLHRFEMLLGNLVGGLGLNQGSFGGIQIAPRDRSLGEELRPAVHNALRQIQVGGRLGQVRLRLYRVFGYGGPGGDVIGTLGRGVSTLVVKCRSLKVAVLEGRQKLTRPDVGTALDVELFHWCSDLGRDGGLGQRRERGVDVDMLSDVTPLRMFGLDVDLGRGSLLRLAAGDRKQSRDRQ